MLPQLVAFEPNPKRKVAMHQRRLVQLTPLLKELNPSVYIVQHKEISFEMGQVGVTAEGPSNPSLHMWGTSTTVIVTVIVLITF